MMNMKSGSLWLKRLTSPTSSQSGPLESPCVISFDAAS